MRSSVTSATLHRLLVCVDGVAQSIQRLRLARRSVLPSLRRLGDRPHALDLRREVLREVGEVPHLLLQEHGTEVSGVSRQAPTPTDRFHAARAAPDAIRALAPDLEPEGLGYVAEFHGFTASS
jgi:hypothetical protein